MRKIIYLLVLLPIVGISQTTTENYVLTTVFRDSLAQKPKKEITYFDGLGRPIQKIAHQQSGTGLDIVTPIEYDAFGRQPKDYLPYVPGDNASLDYRSGALADQPNFADYAGQVSYSEKYFEASPLNRVLKQGAPGNDWALANPPQNPDNTIEFDYQANIDNEVLLYTAVATWNISTHIYDIAFDEKGTSYYPLNRLYKTITKDENWEYGNAHTTEEFKDKEGRVVLKRTYSNSMIDPLTSSFEAHDTYYVYDQYGNLTYVLPPLVTDVTNSQQQEGLCYQYKYDKRNRLVEKKLPGKQWEYIVYDRLDRVVATGPALSPFGGIQKGMIVTRYDVFNRPVYTGWYRKFTVDSNFRKVLQNIFDTEPSWNESRVSSNMIGSIEIGYTTTNSLVADATFVLLTVNYYDDYNFPGSLSFPQSPVFGQPLATNVKGLATGSWVRVLGSASTVQAELTTTFYDALKYAPVYTYLSNYLGGYTETKTQNSFHGLVLKTEVNHKRTHTDEELTVVDEFSYSNEDRLINHFHTIKNKPTELIVHNEYDELGQLKSKNVGGQDTTTFTGLQKVDYSYNIRGWLTGINNDRTDNLVLNPTENDLFAFKINYNQPQLIEEEVTQPLYNGNISQTFWRSANDNIKRKYGYQYDAMNRLTHATYMRGSLVYNSYNENLEYDKNGNITHLQRNGGLESINDLPIVIDDLWYSYDSNQLMSLQDDSNDPMGFKDSGVATANEYSYDANGNMIGDSNKGITTILYNHLNLPTFIDLGTLGTISYLYDATGRKVKKTVTQGNTNTTTDYMNGFQYTDGKLSFFPHAEGFVNVTYCEVCQQGFENERHFNYAYNYTDHLGNIRLTYGLDPAKQDLKILEENHYYPFGLKHTNYNNQKNKYEILEGEENMVQLRQAGSSWKSPYKYRYNSKEYQDELGLNVYDYGARNYDPAIGRWMNIDTLAEKYSQWSPYNYTVNNPVLFVDPDGNDIIVLAHGPRSETSVDNGKSDGHKHLVGHQAVLIGNDKTGWTYLSYDYDKGENKGSGANSDNDVYTKATFKTLDDFKNSEHNTFKEDYDDGKGTETSHRDGDGNIIQRYQEAFQITTDSETDKKMVEAGEKVFEKPWSVVSSIGQANQCTTVAEKSLNAGGLKNGESSDKKIVSPKSGSWFIQRTLNYLPAAKQKAIEAKNKGKDVDDKIKRTKS